MTILEAVKQVLENSIDGMTSKEITETIQKEKLYDFHAVNPHSVVNSIIRRHCQGLVFPSVSTIKYFFINPKKSGKKPYYQLITREIEDYSNEITLTEDNSDVLP